MLYKQKFWLLLLLVFLLEDQCAALILNCWIRDYNAECENSGNLFRLGSLLRLRMLVSREFQKLPSWLLFGTNTWLLANIPPILPYASGVFSLISSPEFCLLLRPAHLTEGDIPMRKNVGFWARRTSPGMVCSQIAFHCQLLWRKVLMSVKYCICGPLNLHLLNL